MTNLILTVIGIVLAAIAALVAFDYGGDYFLDGYSRAQATSISNAGNNVSAAYSVFGMQRRRAPADLAELTSSPQGRSLLKRIPEVQDLGTVRGEWVGLNRGSGVERAFVVEGVAAPLCRTLNQRLNGFADDAVIPGAPAFKSGCFSYNSTTVNVYYTFLTGAPDGGTVGTYRPVVEGNPLPPALPTPTSSWTWPAAPTNAPSALPTTTPAPTQPVTDGVWLECAPEGGTCRFDGEATVRYGSGQSSYAYTSATAQLSCQTSSFESDPSPGVAKTCSYRPEAQPDGWIFCSNEGAACSFGAGKQAEVRFGSLGSYVTKVLKTGATCSATTFANDPAYGSNKACYYRNAEMAPTPVPTATATATPGVGVAACTSGGVVGTSTIGDPDGIVGTILPSSMCRGDDVVSPGGRFRLSFQSDGNLVLSTADGSALWATGTGGSDATRFDVQTDGNAVLYNSSNTWRWRTGTDGWRGQMRLTSDGNLVVYNQAGDRIVWETRTDICLIRSVSDGVGLGGYGRSASIVPRRLCNSEYVDSPDGRFRLKMQVDGNLVLYMGENFDQAIWATGVGNNAYKLVTEGNGNVMSFARDGNWKWRTGTFDRYGARMMVESDGNLVVRDPVSNQLFWETRTERCAPRRVGDGRRTGDFGASGTTVPTRLCNNEFVDSPDGRFRLTMEPGGKLSLRMGDGFDTEIWSSGTGGSTYALFTEGGGNLQTVDRGGNWTWRTGTWDWPGARMSVQNDGNLVVRSADNSRLLWETRSIFCLPAEKGMGTFFGDFGVSGTAVSPRLCNNEYVTSPNGRFRLKMQSDGNLVLYMGDDFDKPIWASGAGSAHSLFQQGSGNWQTEDRGGNWKWRTATWDWPGARMLVQDDGNLVVRNSDNNRLLWETRSVNCVPMEKGVGTRQGDFGTIGTLVSPRLCNNEYVTSPNGKFRLTMQPDGNLVLGMGENYSQIIWNTGKTNAYALFQQGSGNWQTEDRGGGWQWRTGTWDWGGARMMVQNDGNLVVRDAGNTRLLWETRSTTCVPMEKGVGTVATEHGESGTLVGPRLCSNEYVTSPNGLFRLTMQPNGSLALTTGEGFQQVVWETGASSAYAFFQQGSGNWETQDRGGGWKWRTGTWDWPGARFIVQDDGNLVVRSADNSRLLWETRTDRCLPREWNDGVGVDNLNTPGTYVNWRLCNNQYVTSPNKRFRLTMRQDGNLVVGMGENYSQVIWSSNTPGDGYKLIREGSGNVQIIGRDGGWRWRTGTWDRNGARMMLNDLGNLVVVRNPGELFWESRSDRCLPASISAGTETSPAGIRSTVKPFILCQNEWVDSPNGRFRFTLNAQGNLQLLDGVDRDIVLWQSGTNDPNNYRFFSWGDGNHWILNRNGNNVWQTRTWDRPGARMLVQDDGNVTIYQGTTLLWQTNTGGKTGPSPGSVADLASKIRAVGAKAVTNVATTVKIPEALGDVGVTDAEVAGFSNLTLFYRAGEQLNLEFRLSGAKAEEICTLIASDTGGTLSDRGRESTASEGCASFNTGFYYWRRLDDAQAAKQVEFTRAFGASVRSASAPAKGPPSSLADIGMAGANGYNLLSRFGFERGGQGWVFWAQMESITACRALDAAVGNGSRTITPAAGYDQGSYAEGCGGTGGKVYYWKRVDDAYNDAAIRSIQSAGNQSVAAAMSNGGETSSEGRAAAQSALSSSLTGNGFALANGIYSERERYFAEVKVHSEAICRGLDRASGNGDRASLVFDTSISVQGCGAYGSDFWYWRRLDSGMAPGAVFDAKEMYSVDANDDPNGIWNYLEGDPQGGADIPMTRKDGCWYGPCVQGSVDAVQVSSPNQTTQSSTVFLDATTLHMHPGPDRDTVLRFRAPVTGWYRVEGSMKIADTNPSGTVVDWGQGGYVMNRDTPSYAYSYNRRMTQGETVSFRINRAGNYSNDSTQVKARLTFLGTSAPPAPAPSAGHRFWRVLTYRTSGESTVVSVGEIELRATPGGADLTDGAGGVAIQSSQYDGGHAAVYAFDNNRNNRWASTGSSRDNINHWIGYDFGAGKAVDVKEVAWFTRTDCCLEQSTGSGAVQWSDDGQQWSTAFNYVTEPNPTAGRVSLLRETPVTDPDAHRFWRVVGKELNDPYMRTSEIEMRETSDGPNVARYGMPLASSYFNADFHPFYAFNGTTAGRAWATSFGVGYIGVDLLIPRRITELKYASAEGPKAPIDFAFEWSDDGVNWTKAWRQQYSGWANSELRTFTAPPPGTPEPTPVMATSVLITGNIRSACLQIAELEAYSAGVNVALASNGSTVESSPPYDARANAGKTTNGVRPAGYPEIFHSQCYAGDYLRITFAKAMPIDRLVAYGRTDYGRDRDYFAYKLFNGSQEVATGILDATITGVGQSSTERVQQ